MKKFQSILLSIMLLFTANTHAQQMNFQGKIYTGGVPVTGIHTFSFAIPAVSWTETVSVTVNNGLYALTLGTATNPLPLNLFDTTNTSRSMNISYDGTAIDAVTLYAPFQRYQYINLGHDTLFLSQGNYVVLSGFSDTLKNVTVNGNLTVMDTALSNMYSLATAGTYSTFPVNTSVWQSFKATANGKLRDIQAYMYSAAVAPTTATVYIFNGQGPSPASLIVGSVNVTAVPISAGPAFTIPLSSYSITLTSGNTYTFMISPASGKRFLHNCKPIIIPMALQVMPPIPLPAPACIAQTGAFL